MRRPSRILLLSILTFSGTLPPLGASAEPAAERVNVSNIKEKYWARGDESEMGVVQNRLYSKEKKIEIAGFGGITASDPFLTVQNAGLSVGYHFSEYLSLHMISWKGLVGPSSALATFREEMKASTNTNPPLWFLGAEGNASFLYGKLSLLGKSIIYYDMHVTGGAGRMLTENGAYFAPMAGIGQQIYVHRNIALRVDYRVLAYKEAVIDKVSPPGTARYQKNYGDRTNWNHTVMLGVMFLFDPVQLLRGFTPPAAVTAPEGVKP